MSYIKVNYQKLVIAAEKIKDYVLKFERNMKYIEDSVFELNENWKGQDYDAFKIYWKEIYSAKTPSDMTKISMEKYAEALRESAEQYREAQIRAINRANTLCR